MVDREGERVHKCERETKRETDRKRDRQTDRVRSREVVLFG